MPIITLRGQLGSGAPEVGKELAQKLGIDYVDREIIADVAQKLKWTKEGIADKEMPPRTLLSRIAEALGHSYAIGAGYPDAYLPTWEIPLTDTQYVAGLESVIKELANNQAVVIRGRGSQFILKNTPNTTHILLVAPLDIRIKRTMASLNLDEGAAKKEIERFDNSRREFTRRYFNAELEDPLHYDMVINTEHRAIEETVSIILNLLSVKNQITVN